MKKANYTITPFWDKKAVKPDGTSRIMITVNLNRKQFRVTVKLRSMKLDFDKAIQGKGGSVEQKELRKDIADYVNKAESIFKRMSNISKDVFLRFFKSESDLGTSGKTDVYFFFKERHTALELEKRFGSAKTLKCAWQSFKAFKKQLFFEEIDSSFLNAYKKDMLAKGNQRNYHWNVFEGFTIFI